MLRPYNAIVMVCAIASLSHAQTTPMYALRVKPMLGGRASRAHKIKMHYLLQRKLLDNTGYHK